MQEYTPKTDSDYQVWSKAFSKFVLFSLLIHLISAFMSQGYHKLDEYGGIITNTAFKLEMLDSSYLNPGEYPAKIRTWIQPGIYFVFGKIFNSLGGEDPFKLAFIFRLFSSLLGWLSLIMLGKLSYRFIKDTYSRLTALFFLTFLWYLPFFHARTTAENLGSSVFIFGLYFILKNAPEEIFQNVSLKKLQIFGKWKPSLLAMFAAGFMFGLSFEFRFQMSIMVFFMTLWFLLYSPMNLWGIISITLGTVFAIAFGTVVDYWGYGEWTFALWNYWDFNIIQGVASSLGVDPWHRYIYKAFIKGIPPFSLLMLLPALWLWVKKPGHILTWTTLPFLVIHSAISHKELRFIYVLGLFAPLVIGICFEKYKFQNKISSSKLWRRLYYFLLIQNFVALTVASLKPAYSQIGFWKYLYKNPLNEVYVVHEIPKMLRFYLKKDLKMNKLKSYSALETLPSNTDFWVYTNRYKHMLEIEELSSDCKVQYQSYPKWLFNFNYGGWLDRSRVWALYECKNTL